MGNYLKLLILLACCFVTVNIFAAWLDNVPVSVQQPDGTVLELFVTGDEFHRWDARNDYNQTVASGIYFYQLKTDTALINGRMVIIR